MSSLDQLDAVSVHVDYRQLAAIDFHGFHEDHAMEDQEYLSVNNVLNEYFFRGRFEMLPVYLNLEGEAEDEVSETLGIDPEELGDLIGLTAARSLRFDKTDPYVDQAGWLVSWSRGGRSEPPPFTTLLCALSIAAERMGVDENFSANNYSERQFELLGVRDPTPQQKLRQYAKSTRQFWRTLNMWLAENDFRFGRNTGQGSHRGVPLRSGRRIADRPRRMAGEIQRTAPTFRKILLWQNAYADLPRNVTHRRREDHKTHDPSDSAKSTLSIAG